MSQTQTLPLMIVKVRLGEGELFRATVTNDTITGTPAWDAAPTGTTKGTPSTTTASTTCKYTFTTTGIYFINCSVTLTGSAVKLFGWKVYAEPLTTER